MQRWVNKTLTSSQLKRLTKNIIKSIEIEMWLQNRNGPIVRQAAWGHERDPSCSHKCCCLFNLHLTLPRCDKILSDFSCLFSHPSIHLYSAMWQHYPKPPTSLRVHTSLTQIGIRNLFFKVLYLFKVFWQKATFSTLCRRFGPNTTTTWVARLAIKWTHL